MIRSFHNRDTENVWNRIRVKRFEAIAEVAREKLFMLDSVSQLQELSALRSLRLEKLKGDRKGQYSIRVNDQYRICFLWSRTDAVDVELADYH